MAFFGEAYYGECYYSATPYRLGTELTYYVACRVVKAPPAESPSVFDSWVVGLAERFNWLQQGIQTFGLANKIQYATGSVLDDPWGKVYKLPRLTGEGDADYRARLQTYTGVLTGSGTPGNVLPLLNFLVGKQTGVELITRWPGQVIVTSEDIAVLKAIDQYRSRLDSVLPGMFAAGIDYTVLTPFIEYNVVARCVGDRACPYSVVSAVQADLGLTVDIESVVALTGELSVDMVAAVQADRSLPIMSRSAVRGNPSLDYDMVSAVQGEASLSIDMEAAVQGEASLSIDMEAAVQGERVLEIPQCAAVAKTFDRMYKVLASVWLTFFLEYNVIAAVQHRRREATVEIRCRVAKRIS